MRQLGGSIPVKEIRHLAREADQSLLRDTMDIREEDWQGPSLLPGWTRAHVATHLARSADEMRRLTEAWLAGVETDEPSAEERFTTLERGAERTGLELQIDLDTAATSLTTLWNSVSDWHRPVRLLGRTRPLATLPVARLHEVVVHHVDLDCGFSPSRVPPAAASWLLSWVHSRVRDLDRPAVRLESSSGLSGTVGRGEAREVLHGTDADLWAWLSGRAPLVAPDGSLREPLPLLP